MRSDVSYGFELVFSLPPPMRRPCCPGVGKTTLPRSQILGGPRGSAVGLSARRPESGVRLRSLGAVGWRTLGVHELLAGPVCLWWWRDFHRLGVRRPAAKNFELAQSVAGLVVGSTARRLYEGLDQWTFDGRACTTHLAVGTALGGLHGGFATEVVEQLPDEEGLRRWWLSDVNGIQPLTLWWSCVYALDHLFSSTAICFDFQVDPGKLIVYEAPRHAAMAWANFAVGSAQATFQPDIVDILQALPAYDMACEMNWEALLIQAALPIRA